MYNYYDQLSIYKRRCYITALGFPWLAIGQAGDGGNWQGIVDDGYGSICVGRHGVYNYMSMGNNRVYM